MEHVSSWSSFIRRLSCFFLFFSPICFICCMCRSWNGGWTQMVTKIRHNKKRRSDANTCSWCLELATYGLHSNAALTLPVRHTSETVFEAAMMTEWSEDRHHACSRACLLHTFERRRHVRRQCFYDQCDRTAKQDRNALQTVPLDWFLHYVYRVSQVKLQA